MPLHKKISSENQKKKNESSKTKASPMSIDGLERILYLANEENDNNNSILHMNSVCGQPAFTKWLIESLNLNPSLCDLSSNWTPLHTATYCGQLLVANELIKNISPLEALDNDGYSALDLITADLPPYIAYKFSDRCDIYIWGDNRNFSLGHSSCTDRNYPELLEQFSSRDSDIKKVIMSRYHSFFLTTSGQVYSCGIGTGGRLGLGHQETIIQPCRVKLPGKCIDIACNSNHSMMLSESGQLYVCGMNKDYQLGFADNKELVLKPKMLRILLKNESIMGILCGAYHSVMFTKTSVYTWGLNAGQLGHVYVANQTHQTTPRVVSAVHNRKSDITLVSTSDSAILISTADLQIFLLHDYCCKKINFRQDGDIIQHAVTGGKLDPNRVSNSSTHNKEVLAVFLNSKNSLFIWRENLHGLRRIYLFNPSRLLYPSRIAIWSKGLIFVTDKGAAYQAKIPQDLFFQKGDNSKSQTVLSMMLKDDSYSLNCFQIPRIFRGVEIVCDSDGRRFAVRQAIPRMNLTHIPEASQSIMSTQMLHLLEEGPFYDVKIKSCDNQLYPCHKSILSFTSSQLNRIFSNEDAHDPTSFISFESSHATTLNSEDLPVLCLEDCDSQTIHTLLKILYSSCGQQVCGKVDSNVKRLLSRLGANSQRQSLDRLKCGLHDVVLKSSDEVLFPCHKAILSARSEFFQLMFAFSWSESNSPEIVVSEDAFVLSTLLQYIYKDEVSLDCNIVDETQLNNWGRVLAASDFYQIQRLKELLQVQMASALTLRDVFGILELARCYNADELKLACLDFIHINAATLLEMRSFEGISEDCLAEVESYYQQQLSWYDLRKSKQDDIYHFIHQYFLDHGGVDCSSYTKQRASSYGQPLPPSVANPRKRNSKSRRLSTGSSSDDSSSEQIVLSLPTCAGDAELVGKMKDLGVTEAEFPDIDIDQSNGAGGHAVDSEVEIVKTENGLHDAERPRSKSFREIMLEEKLRLENSSSKTDKKSILASRKIPNKLSQRELKLKLAQEESHKCSTSLSPVPLRPAPWSMIPSVTSPIRSSLREIISEEFREMSANCSSTLVHDASSPNTSPRFNQIPTGSPWRDAVAHPNQLCSLTSIQRDEENRAAAEMRVQKKSFELIQIEEKAINELKSIYKSDEVTDEYIVVECVPVNIPAPSWNIK